MSLKDMTPEDFKKSLAAAIRTADADPPPPAAGTKMYADMTRAEQREFRRLHNLPSTYNR